MINYWSKLDEISTECKYALSLIDKSGVCKSVELLGDIKWKYGKGCMSLHIVGMTMHIKNKNSLNFDDWKLIAGIHNGSITPCSGIVDVLDDEGGLCYILSNMQISNTYDDKIDIQFGRLDQCYIKRGL